MLNIMKPSWLIPLSGPALEPMTLQDDSRGLVIGRQETCDLRLPADADKVSRQHARFRLDGNTWRIADLNSRWGTYVNGVKLAEGIELPVNENDLIRIMPWTFSFSRTPPKLRTRLHAHDDMATMHTMVRSVRAAETGGGMAQDLLALLLECAAGLHAAPDEQSLANVLLESARLGSGLANAALLRPTDSAGGIEIIASTSDAQAGASIYSRSLLKAAETGNVAELSDAQASESIVQNRIHAAICVPIMLGGADVAAYLYLDSRSTTSIAQRHLPALRSNASAFCLALGRMASLALANLKRVDIERRQAMLEAELASAGEMQRCILPQRSARIGAFEYTGESRPGRYLGGDFFNVIPLGDDKLAVALGDVSGKGVAASVLMTTAQGFLHASLSEHGGDVARAVTELNRFIYPRRPEGKFITLWAGVIDASKRMLHYVDAGHGYALLSPAPNQPFALLEGAGGVPVGVAEDWAYAADSIAFGHDARLIVVSDGIIEQFGTGEKLRTQFQVEGVQACLSAANGDLVAALFDALVAYAGTDKLADDATIVTVRPTAD